MNLKFISSHIRKLIIPLMLLFGNNAVLAQTRAIYYKDTDGLPMNIVLCFAQDDFGYGWVGTRNGLARFDGYRFTTYEQFKGRNISDIIVDKTNGLWINSDIGLYLYNRIRDDFILIEEGTVRSLCECTGLIHYNINEELFSIDVESGIVLNEKGLAGIKKEEVSLGRNLSSLDINFIKPSRNGVWLCARQEGARLLNTETHLLDGRWVTFIAETNNITWFACRNGDLFVYQKGLPLKKIPIKNRNVVKDIEEINGEYWIGTDGSGVFVLNEDLSLKHHYDRVRDKSSLINSNSIYDIVPGSNGSIWVCTYSSGLNFLSREESAFTNILPESNNPNSLIDKEGVSIDIQGNLCYFGTNYGLSVWNSARNKFINISANDLNNQIGGNKVTAICDHAGYLWIGTYDGTLAKYTKDLRLIKTYSPSSASYGGMNRIIELTEYDDHSLLIATQSRGKNLVYFDLRNESFIPIIQNNKSDRKATFILNRLKKNQFGETIALLRNLGIYLYDDESKCIRNFMPEINNRITFKLNDFYHDKSGNYWFATQADGLVRMSPDGRLYDKWTIEHGFPTNTLLCIESVDDRYLWISTINGLCRFDSQEKELRIFNTWHGLTTNEFMSRASAVTPDNNLLFGTTEGFLKIDPMLITADTAQAEVIISDINFQNTSIKSLAEKPLLTKALEETSYLKFTHKRNSFTISFFTKGNQLPRSNSFKYRMLGLQQEWIYLGETNQASYTNLSPGQYTFEVQGTNRSNVWSNKPTQLQIEILPPWYLTGYAFVIYVFLLGISIFLFIHVYRKRVQLKREVEISEFKLQAEHELTEKKLQFFTNISHDLKTPLTLISAPVNDLLGNENLEYEQIKKLDVIKRNANRLYKLISDLVEFRKISNNTLQLSVGLTNLNPLIKNIYEAFRMECDLKDIDFSFSLNVEQTVCVDSNKVEKILWNLMTNAIKFTDHGGKIAIKISENKKRTKLILTVKDTGKGFTPEQKSKIFDRFYQISQSDNINLDGSGIGLSIVNDLVEIHHGEIKVNSEPGKGSIFKVILPSNESAYGPDEINLPNEKFVTSNGNEITPKLEVYKAPEQNHKKYSLQRLLIVEDNEELRDYLKSHFEDSFKVYLAENGKEGFEKACDKEPDIIISDILMPKSNGEELTRKVRENFSTSHIPVVLLTANSTTEQKIQGISSGADAFIAKPFEIEYLDAVVHAQLNNRKKARDKFMGVEVLRDNGNSFSESDEKFIQGLKNLVLDNLTNDKLNIDFLAHHFKISRTQLNRKVKALTNMTPNNYIRHVRLKRAYELIKKDGSRVYEAAYQTGFTDPNYFTICFKKEFGENPSKLAKV